ncbi:MAG: TauD/TfdA family dioxygenase [Acidimicrobiales bacterium]
MDTSAGIAFKRRSGLIGASVEGTLEQLLAPGAASETLREALWHHQVLAFEQLNPSAEELIALASVFGSPSPPESYNVSHPDFDAITVFDSTGGYRADKWHCDASYRPEVPMGAALCLRKLPSVGGDTVFTNCYAAYDALSGGMKKLLENRRALHAISDDAGTEHPVVVSHPITNRPILFVNSIFTRSITNLPPSEAAIILPFLLEHVTRPDFTYRHRWSEGDVVIWDNWSTQHYALLDYDEQRITHRVALDGGPLGAAHLC